MIGTSLNYGASIFQELLTFGKVYEIYLVAQVLYILQDLGYDIDNYDYTSELVANLTDMQSEKGFGGCRITRQ